MYALFSALHARPASLSTAANLLLHNGTSNMLSGSTNRHVLAR
jgi:hypothetical protein